ncbi:Rad Gem/Kir family member 3 [Carabus blaptoides fortunei]
MADDTLIMSRAKGRSASICATGSSSMEAIAAMESTSNHNTPEGGTPTGQRRRRPAARSQSARIASGRSIRRRAAVAATANHSEVKSHYNSEPKLADDSSDISPGFKRKHSTRRGTSVYHRKSTAFLEIPDQRSAYGSTAGGVEEDEDSYRLRSFSFTSKGIVNRGDSFRRRRSRSNSLIPPPLPSPVHNATDNYAPADIQTYTVALLGAQGVGKTALISQFMTSECINAYDRQKESPGEQAVCIMLNGEESELRFLNIEQYKDIDKTNPPHAFLVMYSVVDKASFLRAEGDLNRLTEAELLRTRPAILIGNKVDLARSKAVSTQDGKCLACTYRSKFIEISVGINHNVDELLVGVLNQIRLKNVHYAHLTEKEHSQPQWYKSRGVVRASMKARQMFTWLFGKEDSKFKNCENLHIL